MANPAPTEGLWARVKSSGRVVAFLATVAGGIAAVAVFFIPTADSRVQSPEPSDAGSPSGESSASSLTGTPEPRSTPTDATAPSTTGRDLAALTPVVGPGAITVEGRDVLIPCPSNQSDDRVREISYVLSRPFSRLDATVSASGQRDPDDSAAVQVFILFRQDRSDRQSETGRAVVSADQRMELSASLVDAVQVSLRVTCSSRTQTVRLTHPQLIL